MSVEPSPREATMERSVGEGDTAAGWGEEFLPAASTPFVLGFAEVTCHRAVADELGDGETMVGTMATIRHLAPSPVGARLRATARLISRDGRRFEFHVRIENEGELVAELEHTRAVVDRAKVLERLKR